MKISNSKKELARIISENGGWREGAEFSVQNGEHGRISFSTNKPVRHDQKSWMAKGGFQFKIEVCKPLPNWHQTILSREEYFHLYPAPDTDEWVEWEGGECPVGEGALIDVKYRDLHVQLGSKVGDRSAVEMYATTHWRNSGGAADIIAYRLHKPEQAKPEFCESVMRSIPEPTAKPTIEQLAADYRNAKDYAERKQQEADDAKADAEAKLAELISAGSALGLVLSVEPEGSAITPAHPPLISGDWRSWRQWEVGDLISWSIVGYIGEFRIIAVHHDSSRNIGDFKVEDKHGGVYRVYGNECRFIRRP